MPNNKAIEGEVMPRPGPVSKYKPEYCQALLQVAEEGGHIAAMRAALGGISKDTWYRWQEDHPEFKHAVEHAKLLSQVFYEKLGLKGIQGDVRYFNAATYALVMHNKFEDDYKKSAGSNTEINVVNNTLNLTSEEVQIKIDQKLEKLKALGMI